ncbi:DUF2835 family protein [Marinobacter sp. R17]|uniref:DUF2835 domain-containing protein n=1 Tax=Marinobacter sp. R17 TaxID=2484250 RepID=UPI000F4CE0FF|nr:DUF2835 domain-containing protein [Marinobacter sp. R17]ROT99561.1 DUF2835 family protein [Marinobacter sp. R17]
MQSIVVDLAIGPEEWIKLYQGVAHDVRTVARDGRSVRFPARILSRFALRDGVHGTFRINFDAEGRFKDIARL